MKKGEKMCQEFWQREKTRCFSESGEEKPLLAFGGECTSKQKEKKVEEFWLEWAVVLGFEQGIQGRGRYLAGM